MLNQEQIVEIRALNKHGQSIRQLAAAMNLSRNTVRRYLRGAPAERKVAERVSRLEPYKAYLLKRVEEARPDWISATVLTREIQELGYSGQVGLVKRFVAPLKAQPRPDPVVRFETAPGVQMQADFVVFRRGSDPLSAFVVTLGHSRASFVRFTTNERSETVNESLVAAFEFFGGVAQQVLFDNAKSVVIERNAYGHGLHRFHPGLLELANAYGFVPRLCRPYRAKTKGKVERFNRFLRHQFYLPLMTRLRAVGLTLDAQTANVEVTRWLREVANSRLHGTTGLIPAEELALERPALLALPLRLPLTPPTPKASQVPMPMESIQHPMSTYAALVEVFA
jgi:transposase